MNTIMKAGSALCLALVLAACGGGGGSSGGSTQSGTDNSGTTQNNPQAQQQPTQSTTPNTVPVTVSSASTALNSPRVSVTVCQPGTTNCTTIPNIILDTGSTGLRLFRSVLPSALALTPATSPGTNDPLGECEVFGGGPAWGQVMTADIQMAGERASAVPIEVMDATFAGVPTVCANQGALMTASIMTANGILGVANNLTDEGGYFDCKGTSCTVVTLPDTQKVPNPVSKFATDNNGLILSFPALATGMAAQSVGSLTFGVNTQADNSASSVTMVEGVSNNMNTAGTNALAFIDSGSAIDYLGNVSLPTCALGGSMWYCPSSTTSLSAVFSLNGSSLNVTYDVANALSLLSAPAASTSYAVADLAIQEDLFGEPTMDLGMSYLYGHTLYLQLPGAGKPMIGVVAG
jgi:hypothetical protein